MPSANGFKLEVEGHTLVAAWPAPFFVLVLDDADELSHGGKGEPMLVHCDDRAHADRVARCGGITTILDAEFVAVPKTR